MASCRPSCECITHFEHIHLECVGNYTMHSSGHQNLSTDTLRATPLGELLVGEFAKRFDEGKLYPKYAELFCVVYTARESSNIQIFLTYLDRFLASVQRVQQFKQAANPEDFSIPGEVSLVFCILGNLCRKEKFKNFFHTPLTNQIAATMKDIKDTLEKVVLSQPTSVTNITLNEEEENNIVDLLENIERYELENEEYQEEVIDRTPTSESRADNELDRKDSGVVTEIEGDISSFSDSQVGIRKNSAIAKISPEQERVQNEQAKSAGGGKETSASLSRLGKNDSGDVNTPNL